jgi:hypothetical protein
VGLGGLYRADAGPVDIEELFMKPEYKVRHICTDCGENVGYLGWLFAVLRIPMLKHKCKEKT